jgi:hypothetical protein
LFASALISDLQDCFMFHRRCAETIHKTGAGVRYFFK